MDISCAIPVHFQLLPVKAMSQLLYALPSNLPLSIATRPGHKRGRSVIDYVVP